MGVRRQHLRSRRRLTSGIIPLVRDNPSITDLEVIAYAGLPVTSEGLALSLCVTDYQPRAWTGADVPLLENLADVVATQIELRLRSSGAGTASEVGA